MKTVIIYQIGRLDFNAFKELDFKIEEKLDSEIKEKQFKTSLSSFALKDFYHEKGYETKVILLYPVSLPLNPSLIKNETLKSKCPKDFYECLEWALEKPEEYLTKPSDLFEMHPHTIEAGEYRILHSLGEYKTISRTVAFNCYYQDIVMMILIDMISSYLSYEDNIKEIIIDISSGHNIYVSALIESFRYLNTWIKLYKWNNKIPILKIAFSDPIIREGAVYKIHTEKQDVKVFFSSPVKNQDLQNYSLAKAIYPEDRAKKQNLQSLLESFGTVFSAIKNNIPLAIYTFGYDEIETLNETLHTLIESIENKLTGDFSKSPNLNKTDYLKGILSCAFYLGICKILKDGKIAKTTEGVEIKELRERFGNIYRTFNLTLNDVILGNEVNKIENQIKEDTDWKRLSDLLYQDKNVTTSSPQKRNFFAHAGFEANLTECQRKDDKIYLRYNKENYELIKKWLMESI